MDFTSAFINSPEFASQNRVVAAELPISSLSRLVDVLLDTRGELQCELSGYMVGEHQRFLRLKVSGVLKLRCQRCLEAVDHLLAVDNTFRLVRPGAPWPDDDLEDDRADAIEGSQELVLLPLIEDEILLALPFAPMHEVCDTSLAYVADLEPSPFAVLAKLKK